MSKKEKLAELKKKALADKKLPLREGATNLVFGVGNPETKILFIGEGPGYWEDIKAEPFVGNAGALLNRLLASIELKREEVFITNMVMFRPPNNRDPEGEELAAFAPYVDGIIKIIDPKVIVTLGRFSMAKFLPTARISSVHGQPQGVTWGGGEKELTVVPMYHPAAALRNGGILMQIQDDFKKLPAILLEIKNKTQSAKIKGEQIRLL